jgi:hypothetical protein
VPSVIESTSVMRGIFRSSRLLASNSPRKITSPKLDIGQTAFSGMRALDLPVKSHAISPLKWGNGAGFAGQRANMSSCWGREETAQSKRSVLSRNYNSLVSCLLQREWMDWSGEMPCWRLTFSLFAETIGLFFNIDPF